MKPIKEVARIVSVWEWEHWRKGVLIDKWQNENLVTNEGLNYLLSVGFKAGTQISSWYIVPVDTQTTPAAAMTYASPTYSESSDYDEAARVLWQGGTVSGQQVSNSGNKATLTFNASTTIYGAALVGGGSTPSQKLDVLGGGTMYSFSLFATAKPVDDDDVLKVTVTLTQAAS